jgi:hypothetical protein
MNKKYRISPEVLSSRLDDEVVLLSIQGGFYYSLEPVASRIWIILSERPATLTELVEHLMEEFDVDPETCIQDVMSFIDDMKAKKLILSAEE